MPAWTTAVRVRSSLFWRRLNAYCMSVVRLVLCPRVTIVLAEQQGEKTCTRCHSLAQPLHPRLRGLNASTEFELLTVSLLLLASWPARGAGHYKTRDVARVRPPSTRNPEEVSVGALPSFRRFRTDTRILSGAAVSTRTQPSARLTAVGRVDRWAGFLMAVEMSHRRVCSNYSARTVWVIQLDKLSIDRTVRSFQVCTWTGEWTRECYSCRSRLIIDFTLYVIVCLHGSMWKSGDIKCSIR